MAIDLPPFDFPKPHIIIKQEKKLWKPLYSGALPGMGPVLAGLMVGRGISSTPTTVLLTSGTTWVVPADYQPWNSTIDAYGAGGSGQKSSRTPVAGAGGGAFARISDVNLTPGATTYMFIGTGYYGGDTWFNFVSASAPTSASQGCLAKRGGDSSAGYYAGTGGQASASIGTEKYSGGNGGYGGEYSAGGGGCAGPSGAGGNGSYADYNNGGTPGGGYAGWGIGYGEGACGAGRYDCEYYGGGGKGLWDWKGGDLPLVGADGAIVITYYAYL